MNDFLNSFAESLRESCNRPATVRRLAATLTAFASDMPPIYIPEFIAGECPEIPEVSQGAILTALQLQMLLIRYADNADCIYFLADMIEG